MSTTYKWPDGQFYENPFKRKEEAKGALRFIKRLRFLIQLYKLIEVTKHIEGNRVRAVSTNIKLVKQPNWARKSQTNRRYSSK